MSLLARAGGEGKGGGGDISEEVDICSTRHRVRSRKSGETLELAGADARLEDLIKNLLRAARGCSSGRWRSRE